MSVIETDYLKSSARISRSEKNLKLFNKTKGGQNKEQNLINMVSAYHENRGYNFKERRPIGYRVEEGREENQSQHGRIGHWQAWSKRR